MKLLFRSVQIVDKRSVHHAQIKDLLIENGTITAIGEKLEAGKAKVFEVEGLHASPGWLDMRTGLRDPGREQDENLSSLKEIAARGGFTGLTLMPNSQPAVDSKGTLTYLLREGQTGPVEFFPTATVTKGAEGKDFTEMIDLHQAGAVAFTDGVNPLHNSDILLKSLQYLRPLDALLINRPEEQYLSLYGQMHEGITSTLLGLKGIPSLAEEMMIIRDLKLLEYALEGTDSADLGGPVLHFAMLSTQKSVALIREAKKKGLPVSCDVAAHQFAYEDDALLGFDTNLKVNPPFRSRADRLALQKGLSDGTIDAVVSDHAPHAPQNKETEFDHAEFGITALETAFSVALMHSGASLDTLITSLTHAPRRILRLPEVSISEGAAANLTFFSPGKKWVFAQSRSLSQNSPFLNQELKGAVNGICNRGELIWF
ncbi:dihydroorotase [Ravibacter arvi]|uniref:Dihydroorotase n=1 Tax=Ravibacter arvi TaxID=2051041 RepID=A0ABP8M9R7_9BACT